MAFSLHAQVATITGTVINASDKKGVPYPAILIKGTKNAVTSFEDGSFKFISREFPVTLIVYQFGFHTREVIIKDNEPVIVELKSKAIDLNEVVVASKKIDTIQKKSNSVYLAFEFYDNYIVALINKGNSYNYIQFLDENGNIVKEKKAPEGVELLFVDCFGNIQLLSKDYSYQLFYDYENILYLEKIPVSEFYTKLAPCQCIFGNYVYFKEVYHRQLKNRYFYISKNKISDRKVICEVLDKDKVQRFDNDFDIRYFLDLRRKGAGYAMSLEELTARLDELRETVPVSEEYLFMMQPIQSELVKRDSFLLIIDYTNHIIGTYNFLGGLIRQDTIELKDISPGTVADKDKNQIFFVGEYNGFTSLYEFRQGKDFLRTNITEFKFIKNLRCRNGVFYFLYRDPLDNSRMKIHMYRKF